MFRQVIKKQFKLRVLTSVSGIQRSEVVLTVWIIILCRVHGGRSATGGRLLCDVCDCGCGQFVGDNYPVPIEKTPQVQDQPDDLPLGSGRFDSGVLHDSPGGENWLCGVPAVDQVEVALINWWLGVVQGIPPMCGSHVTPTSVSSEM